MYDFLYGQWLIILIKYNQKKGKENPINRKGKDMIKGYQTEVLLGSYMKGDPNTGIHYYLLSVMGMNGKRYHCIVRNYGKNADGTPWEDVTIVGEDDGTCESYNYAYKIFRMLVD